MLSFLVYEVRPIGMHMIRGLADVVSFWVVRELSA